jgi:electron transport complex protein RnfC
MGAMRGGMEFVEGQPVQLLAPPESTASCVLQLTCPSRPEVVAGQRVRAGMAIAEPPDERSGCRVSPIDGTVRRLIPFDDAGRGGVRSYVIVVEPEEPLVPTSIPLPPPQRQSLEPWLALFRRTGSWREYGLPFGLIEQLAAVRDRPPAMLICIGLDQFPPYPVRSSLLVSFPDDVVLGTQVIGELMGAREMMVLATRQARVLARLRDPCRNFRMRLESVHNVYPAADPTLVAMSYAPPRSRLLPHGGNPGEVGLVMITPWTAIRIARWFTHGRLDLVRPLLIGWPRVRTSMTIAWAMPGQPLGSLDPSLSGDTAQLAGRVVAGNPMTGRALIAPHDGHDTERYPPAVPDDELLVSVLASLPHAEPEPCISCGWCVDVCPTRLNPWRLALAATTHPTRVDVAEQLRWCIACGLCSHVCPSQLPLAQTLAVAKGSSVMAAASSPHDRTRSEDAEDATDSSLND